MLKQYTATLSIYRASLAELIACPQPYTEIITEKIRLCEREINNLVQTISEYRANDLDWEKILVGEYWYYPCDPCEKKSAIDEDWQLLYQSWNSRRRVNSDYVEDNDIDYVECPAA